MSEYWQRAEDVEAYPMSWRELKIPLHAGLFVLTLFTTTLAGVQWIGLDPLNILNLPLGVSYSVPLLFILGSHEFGHFFYSLKHRVRATLPYFIPFPFIPGMINFGTLGAVIRTKTPVPSRRALFDIGVSGPIVGFIASLAVLVYGFTHLPSREYLLLIHPNFDFATNSVPVGDGTPFAFGNTLLFKLLELILTNPRTEFIPPMSEIYHYPFLCTGWFGLFVTAMNLLPVGQLDGGHLIYAMFGRKHKRIARVVFGVLIALGIMSLLPLININITFGWLGWLFWAAILFFVVKIDHPPVVDNTPLDTKRKIIGWLTIVIFILCFSPTPFTT